MFTTQMDCLRCEMEDGVEVSLDDARIDAGACSNCSAADWAGDEYARYEADAVDARNEHAEGMKYWDGGMN